MEQRSLCQRYLWSLTATQSQGNTSSQAAPHVRICYVFICISPAPSTRPGALFINVSCQCVKAAVNSNTLSVFVFTTVNALLLHLGISEIPSCLLHGLFRWTHLPNRRTTAIEGPCDVNTQSFVSDCRACYRWSYWLSSLNQFR